MGVSMKPENLKEIYFAGGCFWGVEEYFSRIPGVYDVTVGYANGTTQSPTYEAVCAGDTGYAEAVQISYDPEAVSLRLLTQQLFEIIDPFSLNRQGNDSGAQYRSGIYYVGEEDRPVLEQVVAELQAGYTQPFATELLPLTAFTPAEEYHQDYLKKNPGGYCHISFDSLKKLYPRPSREELKKRLTPQQYEVTQNAATEAPFTGEYWNSKERGLYVDITTGEPLFTSADKFDSGCGWPSFTKPVESSAVVENTDKSHGMVRTEVRSKRGDAHLGHVFTDGPAEAGGLRYCINSASLRFIPYEKLEQEGYGSYKDRLPG